MPKKDFSKQTVASTFFSTPAPMQEPMTPADQENSIIQLPIDRLMPYPDQPFRAYAPDKLHELADDIKDNGILSPVIVRPLNGDYQILSGHNRVAAAKMAGLTDIPCIVKIVNNDEAMLILVNTNLNQRQELLPSEKAHAYKMRMDALNRQGKRTDLTSYPEGTKLDTAAEIAENESRVNVYRYLRLNQLHETLLEKVDSGQLQFKAAVQLSYLTEEQQEDLLSVMQTKHIQFDEKKAERLKAAAKESAAPISQIIGEVFTVPTKITAPKLTKKISIVVPTDEKVIEQFQLIQKQYEKGSSIYIVMQEIIEKIT